MQDPEHHKTEEAEELPSHIGLTVWVFQFVTQRKNRFILKLEELMLKSICCGFGNVKCVCTCGSLQDYS